MNTTTVTTMEMSDFPEFDIEQRWPESNKCEEENVFDDFEIEDSNGNGNQGEMEAETQKEEEEEEEEEEETEETEEERAVTMETLFPIRQPTGPRNSLNFTKSNEEIPETRFSRLKRRCLTKYNELWDTIHLNILYIAHQFPKDDAKPSECSNHQQYEYWRTHPKLRKSIYGCLLLVACLEILLLSFRAVIRRRTFLPTDQPPSHCTKLGWTLYRNSRENYQWKMNIRQKYTMFENNDAMFDNIMVSFILLCAFILFLMYIVHYTLFSAVLIRDPSRSNFHWLADQAPFVQLFPMEKRNATNFIDGIPVQRVVDTADLSLPQAEETIRQAAVRYNATCFAAPLLDWNLALVVFDQTRVWADPWVSHLDDSSNHVRVRETSLVWGNQTQRMQYQRKVLVENFGDHIPRVVQGPEAYCLQLWSAIFQGRGIEPFVIV